jgi:hypothetical protein
MENGTIDFNSQVRRSTNQKRLSGKIKCHPIQRGRRPVKNPQLCNQTQANELSPPNVPAASLILLILLKMYRKYKVLKAFKRKILFQQYYLIHTAQIRGVTTFIEFIFL